MILLGAALVAAVVASGCDPLAPFRRSDEGPVLYQIAVLPLGRVEADNARELATLGDEYAAGEPPHVAPDAEKVVTAQIYGVLAEHSRFVVIPDLTVRAVLPSLPSDAGLVQRAQAFGRATSADAVLCGTVSRFVEREGSDFGVTRPASVGFGLELVRTETGEILWQDRFDRTQEPLSSNLFNWWMFWRAGPRWLTARELARLGVERLLERMQDEVG